jgi:hypothetical protein
MLIPLYGFLEGDTLGLLILVEAHETVHDLAIKLQQAANVRVAWKAQVEVRCKDRVLHPQQTIAQADLTPLERVDVIQKDD